MKTLFSSEMNYKNLRNQILQAAFPSIPYMELYLSDLAFIDSCGPNVFPDGKVNFQKLHQISDKILEIHVCSAFFIFSHIKMRLICWNQL
jgi:hypothetical protein